LLKITNKPLYIKKPNYIIRRVKRVQHRWQVRLVPLPISCCSMEFEKVTEEFAKKFIERRADAEKFDISNHSFYIHNPEQEFLSVLFTGYIQNFYYISPAEVFNYSVPLHKEVIKKDLDFYIQSLKIAREIATMKDQVIIGLLLLSKHEKRAEHIDLLVDLLSSFPPNQIIRKFVNTKRKNKELFGGFGSFEKGLIKKVFEVWKEKGLMDYYFVKYRRYIQQLINISHIKVEKEQYEWLSNPKKYQGKNEYFNKIKDFYNSKEISSLPDKTPFEIIRGSLKKENWRPELLKLCDITANTIVLQATSFYSIFGDEMLPYVNKATGKRVTADKILKALLMAEIKGYSKLTKELAKAYAEKVKTTYKDLLLPLDNARICVVLDASGSMGCGNLFGVFLKSLSCIAPFSPIINSLILFSNNAKEEDNSLLSTWEGILKLMRIAEMRYNKGTDIGAGLSLAIEKAKEKEINTVILVTDEQSNLLRGSYSEMELIKKLLDMGIQVIVINPTPYPIKVTDISDKRLIYVNAPNPESLKGALRLSQLKYLNLQAKPLLEKMVICIKKSKKKKENE